MRKVLIAEDDQDLADAYQKKLTLAGFEVKIASDGQEALDTLNTFTPDIILLDMIMPVKDGFSTLEDLKRNEKWKDIPVIVASNLGQKEEILPLGAVDHVIKSNLHLEDLVKKINTILDKE